MEAVGDIPQEEPGSLLAVFFDKNPFFIAGNA
jgi:hypothetical protein